MTKMPFDWDTIHLAVFDVDGTLYRQFPIRLRMASAMLWHMLTTGKTSIPRVVWHYRRIREQLAEEEVRSFLQKAVTATAIKTGLPAAIVSAILEEWIENRPLKYLARHRYPTLDEVFLRLRQRGTTIGIFSDYPATDKLSSLGLFADIVVTADDVGVMKPHQAGIERLMSQAKVTAEHTVMIGDRVDRDGAAARRAGVHALIRSKCCLEGWQTFSSYSDPVFMPLLTEISSADLG